MKRKLLLAIQIVLFSSIAFSQEEDSLNKGNLKISGSADVYYKYDFAKTRQNSYTSFTQSHDQFALGMASVKLEYTTGKVGVVADLGFGQRAKDFSYTDDGITQAIKQAYVYYAPVEQLKFTAGTWATHVGYELLDPQLNRNYSMSYMFTTGPFSHTGIKAEFNSGKHGLMLGVANPTDYRIVPDDVLNSKQLLAQYSFAASDAVKLFLNYVGGKIVDTASSRQIDAVVTAGISDKFSIGLNSTLGIVKQKSNDALNWWGTALYFNYDPISWFGLTLRSEYFNDKDHLKTLSGVDGDNIFANTLSFNFKKSGFTFIPEVRYDAVNKAGLFINKDGNAAKNDVSVLFAAIYSF